MLKSKSLKVLIILLGLFIGILFYSRGGVSGSQEKELVMSLRDFLLSSFVAELPEINRKLPHKIDGSTTLLSIEYLNDQIISRYELTGIRENANLNSTIEYFLKKQACLDEVKRKLLDVDVWFIHRYQDDRGKLRLELIINKASCLEFSSST